ncbi:acyl-ACP desaturase [Nocardia cerradoensis]|uniref:acyl-ACP desaturase n=1 Tax=Nocardia cerradoensis TaxID=85688 RepID=UPI0002E777F0|nr:acyl-ACP desaturase [Nocardia cerradoensis]NKY43925.1 acyl-ACP desaturase [Nocardia cerradoensis]
MKVADRDLLRELEPVAERCLADHLRKSRAWHPHDYVPWGEGRNFAALGGNDWAPEQSALPEVARVALVTTLLAEDDLPSCHRVITETCGGDGVWGRWVGCWTAEENRHALVIRDYLVVTRAVDPVALERARMTRLTSGVAAPGAPRLLRGLACVTLLELATRISHRNTGIACGEPIADRMLSRIATDENLHMIFYRNISRAALELAPDAMMRAITEAVTGFRMPGSGRPGFRRHALLLAAHGIYDPAQHLERVVRPVLRNWHVFERTDLTAPGERARDELAVHLATLEKAADRFRERRERVRAREAAFADASAVVQR